MDKLKKRLFQNDLPWPRLILLAVLAAVLTAAAAILPALKYTSFSAITATFEVWILFGILIIMNSSSNMDSALKCFVFFLISQPLIYLLQVPFSWQGSGLFQYYKYWFLWTVLCLPMGYIGYYLKLNKWWGLLILLPMLLLTAYSYHYYLHNLLFYIPRYLLICLFCVVMLLAYPLLLLGHRTARVLGTSISLLLILALTVLNLLNPPVYSPEVLSASEELPFDKSYTVSLADSSYGDASIVYIESIDQYMIHTDLKKAGSTRLILQAPDGTKTEYDFKIEIDTYELTKK